ncbi:hypothetical protein LG634_14490 [Streptomyces bambusae]|uniref:hypothetical protein n=1 Tax=Streptomyces bambusae TaxID=1550616 RepID=UPI001CFDA2DF|nr:hypothetical protein [Streptomyces bambusae]MCB5166040.1 hypothetical protein [Streptomyces bambusae]
MSGVELGDAPSWIALALAAGAFVVSLKARGDSKRSASATVASSESAKEAVAEARKSADAAVRSASAAEQALALQHEEAEARRAAEEEARRPRVELGLLFHRGSLYHLVNQGSAPAVNLRLLTAIELRPPDLPASFTLEPGAVRGMMLVGSMTAPVPDYLEFVWDGQEEPVRLRVPPKI